MAITPDTIDLSWADLKKLGRGLTDAQARKIIANAKRALVSGRPVELFAESSGTVKIKKPPDLGNDPVIIVLTTVSNDITENNDIVAALSFDPKTGTFSASDDGEDEDEDDIIAVAQKDVALREGAGKTGKEK